ncbi:hypothetical protein C2G38_2029339 [Gigaspora rosea]|uniref:Uncharacterized protein n=1 Tax=Gigaspora rosea TaxID=44941 RepID=A0A397W839_9GLOM|nr:hypothetical protein C2G38_2029339 [Gigaspora rosea]
MAKNSQNFFFDLRKALGGFLHLRRCWVVFAITKVLSGSFKDLGGLFALQRLTESLMALSVYKNARCLLTCVVVSRCLVVRLVLSGCSPRSLWLFFSFFLGCLSRFNRISVMEPIFNAEEFIEHKTLNLNFSFQELLDPDHEFVDFSQEVGDSFQVAGSSKEVVDFSQELVGPSQELVGLSQELVDLS